jgi:hypothetical protein
MKLSTPSAALDKLNHEIEATRRATHVKVDKATLFALLTDHRDLCRALEQRGIFVED